jgi:hypothetical protein
MNNRRTIWPPFLRGIRPLAEQWRDFWRTPDPLLLHEGGSGELTVARLRLLVITILLVLPLLEYVQTPDSLTARASFWTASIAFVLAVTVFVLIKRSFYRPWFGFATSIMDVTFVSAALVVLLVVGRPDVAATSHIIYPAYFIAVGAMALRYDARICVLGGLLGLLEYAIIIAFADAHWNLGAPPFSLSEYGQFSLQPRRSLLSARDFGLRCDAEHGRGPPEATAALARSQGPTHGTAQPRVLRRTNAGRGVTYQPHWTTAFGCTNRHRQLQRFQR